MVQGRFTNTVHPALQMKCHYFSRSVTYMYLSQVLSFCFDSYDIFAMCLREVFDSVYELVVFGDNLIPETSQSYPLLL